ncbi:histone deacetylase 11-like [Watersipora subatra]|uniref:histone deacetylase 11-like n=1 Tax=Watersipora subatra TaxID=2589382 RepID=UPI00355C7E19
MSNFSIERSKMASQCEQMFEQLTTLKPNTWPVLYSSEYNITFCGMEKLHPMDSSKWGNTFAFLQAGGMLSPENVVTPPEISREQLIEFHTERYINSLRWSANVARITEVPPVACVPNFLVQRNLLRRLRLQTSGTILAAKLALDHGWSINLGGGFHHCSSDAGGGFCAYADISGALKTLHRAELISKALIIDLDAHQGNGHERDFLDCDWVHTLDVYNHRIYPFDQKALKMKNLMAVQLHPYTEDGPYLKKVSESLDRILAKCGDSKPNIIAYNAGTDCLMEDPLGALNVSPQGIMQRDELVFRKAKELNIPIFMVLSGGYLTEAAKVVADSILNLREKGLISAI